MAASDDAKVPSTVVSSAVDALMKWKSKAAPEKLQLLPQDDLVYLTVTLKKIPDKSRTNAYKIPLPHPLFDSTSSEVCLFVDDRPKSKLTSEAAKKIVKDQGIPVSKVISLSKLKANYKAFDSRRKLCNSYELFLVDKRIVHLLPRLLGKSFFQKKKIPLPVELTRKDWKKHVLKAMGCGFLFMRTGTCSVMKVGKVSMEREEIVENVVEAIDGAVKVVPRNWDGVRSLHLKLTDSAALPLYQALPDLKLKIDGPVKDVEVVETEVNEASSAGEEEKKSKKKKRGRIHEVQYMDVGGAGAVELDAGDEKMEEVKNVESEDAEAPKKKKKKEDKVKNVESEDAEAPKKKKKEDKVKNVESEGAEVPKKKKEDKVKNVESEGAEVPKKKKKKEDKVKNVESEDAETPKKKEKKEGKKGRLASVVTAESGEKKEKKRTKLGEKLKEATTVKKATRSSTRWK